MLEVVLPVILATTQTSIVIGIHIVLYTWISRIFLIWFDFHAVIGFFCSQYCVSKIIQTIFYLKMKIQLRLRKSDDIIAIDDLSAVSADE